MQFNQRTLQILRDHGPMSAGQFGRLVDDACLSAPSIRLVNAMHAGLITRSRPEGAPHFVYAAPEEGPLLAALRAVQGELTKTQAVFKETCHEIGEVEAELQTLQMRLAQLQDQRARAVADRPRLEAGKVALTHAVYGTVPTAYTLPQPAPDRVKVVPLRGPAPTGVASLTVFDDPNAYPQVQEG